MPISSALAPSKSCLFACLGRRAPRAGVELYRCVFYLLLFAFSAGLPRSFAHPLLRGLSFASLRSAGLPSGVAKGGVPGGLFAASAWTLGSNTKIYVTYIHTHPSVHVSVHTYTYKYMRFVFVCVFASYARTFTCIFLCICIHTRTNYVLCFVRIYAFIHILKEG